ncbi:MAG: class I SAM-dependent methyltransferase [Gemmatimonadetes bacterium]|nr:class I SAM-dependent methyltransferase [Gemmatimonadota bacterium]
MRAEEITTGREGSAEHWRLVADGFSQKALEYEAFWTDHPNFTRMRERVQAHFDGLLAPASRILELNAGTGIDALRLARRGHRVHATDLAPGMIAAIEAKMRTAGLGDRLSVQRCSYLDLELVSVGPFDAVFSNFGGLNCVEDLGRVTRLLKKLLVPGGLVTWVIMPPICPWEWLALRRGDWGTAVRRLRPGGVIAHVGGAHFRTYYFTPRQVIGSFGSEFRPIKLEGLSLFAPPGDRKEFAHRHPHWYRTLVRLDDWLCTLPPFRNWGDFFILSLRYRRT